MKIVFKYFRYFSWIAILCSLAGSVLLFGVGAQKTYSAYEAVVSQSSISVNLSHLDTAEIATTYIIKALDTFLIALVLFIFAHGVFTLFICGDNMEGIYMLDWIKTPNIGRLKSILGEVIVIILFVKFLEIILVNLNNLNWNILILPTSIIMLALSLKILRLGNENSKNT